MEKIRLIVALILFFVFNAAAQTFPVTKIIENGPVEERINIVILGDGYTLAEMPKFRADVSDLSAHMFSVSPLKEYKTFFNIFAIEVASNESGANHAKDAVDEPGGNAHPQLEVDNFFGSKFDFNGIHRLLYVTKSSLVRQVAAANVPLYDQVFVLVNSEFYGGGGGSFAVVSTHNSAKYVLVHEMGHSFANLADEYSGNGGTLTPRERANSTAETDRNKIKWKNWIEASTPVPTPAVNANSDLTGLFEGAVYRSKDWYRPMLRCKMRTSNKPFCSVCKETMVERIHTLLPMATSVFPQEATVLAGNEPLEFKINLVDSDLSSQVYEWRLNDNLLSERGPELTLDPSQLGDCQHKLRVQFSDDTDLVRKDDHATLHNYENEWIIDKSIEAPNNNLTLSPPNNEMVIVENESQLFELSNVNNAAYSYQYKWFLNDSALSGSSEALILKNQLSIETVDTLKVEINALLINNTFCADSSFNFTYSWQLSRLNPSVTSIINEVNKGSLVFLAPNPVKDLVKLSIADEDAHQVTLYNAEGKIIMRKLVTKNIELSMQSYPSGIYFIKVQFSDGEVVKKLNKL